MSDQVGIGPQRAAELLKEGAQAVDVREQYEWDAGRIEDSHHIPLNRLMAGPTPELDPESAPVTDPDSDPDSEPASDPGPRCAQGWNNWFGG